MNPDDRRRLQRLDRLAEFLDESIRIPGIGYRIGYDAIIGIIPGVGDVAGLMVGAYIVLEASRFKVPRSSLLRMIANVILEAAVGAIPLVGDVFDATYKSNIRNLKILHARLNAPVDGARSDRSFFALLIAIPLVALVLLVALLIWIASAVM